MVDRSGAAGRDCGRGFAELIRRWRDGGRVGPPIVMGIVNVTPDSFSDGGFFAEPRAAVAHGRRLVEEGAAILDIGGESTRRGAAPVPAAEELRRAIPVLEGLALAGALLSVDTMKAEVAEAALAAGAHVINDIRGLQGDAGMAEVAARHRAGVIVMHNPGLLGSTTPLPGDPIEACLAFFERSLTTARRAGIPDDRIAFDPGIGFGKSAEQNLEIVARTAELVAFGFPILIGTSRKGFIGEVTGREAPQRLVGSLVTNVVAALHGAAIIRVHDVAEHVEAMRMTAAIRGAAPQARP